MSMYFSINSQFKPLTYNEMVQPLLQYKEAYEQVENDYSTLAAQAEAWRSIADREKSPKAYDMYRRYSGELENLTNDLTQNGLSFHTRGQLLNMKKRYAQEIAPIQVAYENRKKDIDRISEARLKDSSLLVSSEASMSSLDDYLGGNTPTYNTYSGSLITAQVSNIMKNMAKSLRNMGKGAPVDNFTNTFIQQYGVDPKDILKAIDNPRDADSQPMLHAIMKQVIDSTGIEKWNNPEALDKAYWWASQGLWSGVGEDKVTTVEDYGKRLAAKTASEKDLANYKANLEIQVAEAKERIKNGGGDPSFGPRLILGGEGEKDIETQNRIKGFKTILKNGKLSMSTDKIADLERQLDEANKELSGFSDKEVKAFKDYETSSSLNRAQAVRKGNNAYTNLGATIADNMTQPKGYTKWKAAQNKVDNLSSKLKTESDYISDLYDKYMYLDSDPAEAIKKGVYLDNLQAKQETSRFSLNLKESQYDDVRNGTANMLLNVPEAYISKGTVGLVDSKGRSVGVGKTKEILSNEKGNRKNITVGVTGGNNPRLSIVYKGEEYTIKGVEQIANYEEDLKTTNNFMKDFSEDAVLSKSISISEDQFNRMIATNSLDGLGARAIRGSLINIGNRNKKGLVLNVDKGKEYVKVIIDNNGGIVAMNTLSDELAGGEIRDSYFMNMASKGLSNLNGLVAKKD